jgi:hemerythrin-like domain-containing protein
MLTTEQTDIFTTGATHMAHIHNAILRGYNSIYQQAAHVKEEDKAAFIGYALAWYRFVKSHHDDEEAELFPKVEQILGTKGVWDETHAEHGKSISLSLFLLFPPPESPPPLSSRRLST